jgi:hypothetical protein
MMMGLLSGIITALVAASVLLGLSDAQFYGASAVGTAAQDYAGDLPTAVLAALIWFLPVGIFVFPPVAKFLAPAGESGNIRLLKFAVLGAALWLALAEAIYLVLSPLAPAPPGVQSDDLISAALSGILFAVIFDILLRRRDYLLDRKPR